MWRCSKKTLMEHPPGVVCWPLHGFLSEKPYPRGRYGLLTCRFLRCLRFSVSKPVSFVQVDPTGAPHVGGNRWAGGSGGSDTAGLGGRGGPYRLWDGNPVPDRDRSVPETAGTPQCLFPFVFSSKASLNRVPLEETPLRMLDVGISTVLEGKDHVVSRCTK